jgi:hypothetical protein
MFGVMAGQKRMMMSAVQELNKLLGNPQTVVSEDKTPLIKSLLQQYARLGVEEESIAKSRAEVRSILVGLFEEGSTELVIDSNVVATFKPEVRMYLNTDVIKNTFPHEEYGEFYEEKVSEVFRLKRVKGE